MISQRQSLDNELLELAEVLANHIVETEKGCYCGNSAEHYVDYESNRPSNVEEKDFCLFCKANLFLKLIGKEK